jgi:NADP-dependent 3-hydroxy acid dehydrogenase YdfG
MAPDEFSGAVALVTGGGRGVGANIAHELAGAGMRVAVAARTRAQVERVAQEIGGVALELDVSDEASVTRVVGDVERELGPIDLLVNGAGIANASETAIWEQRAEDWWRVFEVNVLGTCLCCRAALRGMVERGRGRIVNLGSGAGYLAVTSPNPPGGTSYLASKAALNRFGEALAAQVGWYSASGPRRASTGLSRCRLAEGPWAHQGNHGRCHQRLRRRAARRDHLARRKDARHDSSPAARLDSQARLRVSFRHLSPRVPGTPRIGPYRRNRRTVSSRL